MKMNRKELKKTISDFNTISTRLLQSDYDEYIGVLKRFLNFIESTEIVNDFIQDCGGYCADIEESFNEVCQSFEPTRFNFSIGTEEETSEIYSLVKLLCENNFQHPPLELLTAYSYAKKYNDMVKDFNHKVIFVLVGHIENYLKKVGIDMGLDSNITYNINGNQVNVANDNATINATQNNGIDAAELKKLFDSMRNSLSEELSEEDKKDAEECIDIIEQELQSNNPNEETVKTRFKLLKRIDCSVKFLSACASVATFANRFYPFLDQIALMFQG
ncbi:MAG: hypothetical protein HDT42_12075 [Ruminococcaceae bacterium]|nr:hypothetical protein [Oscillospiraceae bacterium]